MLMGSTCSLSPHTPFMDRWMPQSLKHLFQIEVVMLNCFSMILVIYRTEMSALNLQAFVVKG